jgi:hypothetical protein
LNKQGSGLWDTLPVAIVQTEGDVTVEEARVQFCPGLVSLCDDAQINTSTYEASFHPQHLHKSCKLVIQLLHRASYYHVG